ncbi:substrate-binding periplasmic protein [Pseudoalteromonas sp. H105]|uniref:substrate-binding periplasmic protein n=1 Tax=Pseudoalteromonas sp. H105 TaxID=1348393 RepID=UPI0007323E5A|nr:transporter substrate-binding domain-containing protein [Pseudoalteromonas sp. H105]KTF13965.1 hypothetical protein ATS75_12625 [Pseudoalteromonas sp. H105]
MRITNKSVSGRLMLTSILLCALCAIAHAKPALTIASGNFAPYFKEENVDGKGYFDLVLLKVLQQEGYSDIRLVSLNNDAIKRYFINDVADIAINYTALPPANSFPSIYRVKFLNRIIMHKNQWSGGIKKLTDLNGLTLASFTGASNLFGDEYKAYTQSSTITYFETANQQALNKLLHKKKIDVRIGDYLMFYRHTAHLSGLDPNDYVSLNLLDYQGSFIVFNNKKIRDQFDHALTKLIQSGEIKTITQNWLEFYNLPTIVDHSFFSATADR